MNVWAYWRAVEIKVPLASIMFGASRGVYSLKIIFVALWTCPYCSVSTRVDTYIVGVANHSCHSAAFCRRVLPPPLNLFVRYRLMINTPIKEHRIGWWSTYLFAYISFFIRSLPHTQVFFLFPFYWAWMRYGLNLALCKIVVISCTRKNVNQNVKRASV